MNLNTAPTLPLLAPLLIGTLIDASLGFAYGKLFRANPGMTAAIAATYTLGKQILYHFTNKISGNHHELQSHKIFVAIFLLSHTTFLIVLRQFNIIGQTSLLWLGAAGSIVVANRVFWIYKNFL